MLFNSVLRQPQLGALRHAPNMEHILAVANEEGFVRLYNTESQAYRKKCFKEWMAHWNAVFDLAWVPGEFKLVTAAGDQTAKFWDVKAGELIGTCKGHQCSLKSVAFSKFQKVAIFNGHQNSTFYVKSSLSPDDQFLISGSSDEAAYIWKVSTPWQSPTVLLGHTQEVTSVCWCPSDFTKIATCSDDNTLKVWRLNRGLEEKSGGDKLSMVGWASQKKKEMRAGPVTLTSSQSTPAKAPRVKSSPSISSPSSAACTPSCAGDLPLPSNTPTFSIKTPPAKSRSPINRRGSASSASPKPPSSFKMSIKNWVTLTPSSSPPVTPPASETKIMSPRKALIPVSQKSSQTEASSESRNRVKRRLDSSCLENVKQKCVKSCNCVTELDGQVENLHLDLCCIASNQEDLSKDSLGPTKSSKIEGASTSISEPPSPVSPYASESCGTLPLPLRPCGEESEVVGKENSSPENKNWLLAMAAKWKSENLSPRSPTPQTPNSRRQSGKTSPGPVSWQW
ncbi:Denticleless protein like protein [Tupaia chinensis]|uniref:Denticleless protein like protein n=1 Tax=Tupaia chinensis TaxID=246437 RepID=L8Y933_TUPCH|nr:Denticleless protein like protein [Tupaia chinensis]